MTSFESLGMIEMVIKMENKYYSINEFNRKKNLCLILIKQTCLCLLVIKSINNVAIINQE